MNKFFATLGLVFLLSSCAMQVPPSGGPKDQVPPKIVREIPFNNNTFFSTDKIEIRLDKYIELKDLEQITVSPTIYPKPEISSNGKKSIIIKLGKAKLDTTKTYTINFGSTIRDTHEGKSLENFNYVFSPGSKIDQYFVTGIILNSENLKTQRDFIIGLFKYNSFCDTTPSKSLPSYFTRCSDSGTFNIEHLPDDTFQLFAFNDLNRNMKWDKNENVAFCQNPISPKNETNFIKLYSFRQAIYNNNQIVDTINRDNRIFDFAISQPNNIQIHEDVPISYIQKNIRSLAEVDTIRIYKTGLRDTISHPFKISTKDTTYHLIIKNRRPLKNQKLELKTDPQLIPGDTLCLLSSIPIEKINQQRIDIKVDTIKNTKGVLIKNQDQLVTGVVYTGNETIEIDLKDSAVQDILGSYSKSLKISLPKRNIKEYGSIVLTVENQKHTPCIVLLVADNETEAIRFKKKVKGSEVIHLDFISPEILKIKIILDVNENGKWDSGDWKKRIEPEKVYYLPIKINVRSQWEIEQSVPIDQLISNP